MIKHLVFIIDKPLHGNVKAQEFLDSILMAAAFDQRVDVVFVGDGVFAMLDNQQPEKLDRSEEHTSELQSLTNLVCRLLLDKKQP